MKCFRILEGFIWKWESDGEYLRMVRIAEIDYSIGDLAEKLIKEISQNNKPIIYDLR